MLYSIYIRKEHWNYEEIVTKSRGGAFNRTITGLADILGFGKKKEVSGKVISSEYDAILPIGILCESTVKDFSHFTSHFSQNNPSPENQTFAQAQVDFLPSPNHCARDKRIRFSPCILRSLVPRGEGRIFMVPSLFKGRLGWVFGRRSASSVRNFAPTRGEGDDIDFSCESTETVLSPLTFHYSQKNPPQPSLEKGGRKAAFTLAEVLITLGIIGVVAAITMPTLIQNHRNHVVETRLKKFYSSFNQAFLMAEAEFGDNSTWDVPTIRDNPEWFQNHFGKHLNVVKYEKTAGGYLIIFFADGGALTMYSNADWWYMPVAKPDSSYRTCFGTNNENVGSSCFAFNFRSFLGNRKGIEPYRYAYSQGLDLYTYSYLGCAKDGWWCTLAIQQNGWKIPDDYPRKIKY